MEKMEYSIRIRELTKDFSGKKVIDGICLDVSKGEIFGLLGPSGAGKTTLIKILTAQLKADGGEAELLFAGIYNILKPRVKGVLKKVGLQDAAKRLADRLSKGMRQRLTLARALMHEPEILFLDEPTSGLDPSTAMEIRELIRQQKDRGAAVFLTTHNMEEAASLCDHVALLFDGKIMEYGEPDAICRRYNGQNEIKILLKDKSLISLPNDSTSADLIGRYIKEEQVESIHSSEPDLETVFMKLTGKGLIET